MVSLFLPSVNRYCVVIFWPVPLRLIFIYSFYNSFIHMFVIWINLLTMFLVSTYLLLYNSQHKYELYFKASCPNVLEFHICYLSLHKKITELFAFAHQNSNIWFVIYFACFFFLQMSQAHLLLQHQPTWTVPLSTSPGHLQMMMVDQRSRATSSRRETSLGTSGPRSTKNLSLRLALQSLDWQRRPSMTSASVLWTKPVKAHQVCLLIHSRPNFHLVSYWCSRQPFCIFID